MLIETKSYVTPDLSYRDRVAKREPSRLLFKAFSEAELEDELIILMCWRHRKSYRRKIDRILCEYIKDIDLKERTKNWKRERKYEKFVANVKLLLKKATLRSL